MNETRFRALVAELDQGVPRAQDAVRLVQGEGVVTVIATRQGALRLGIAILRAALEKDDKARDDDELVDLIDDHGTWIEDVSIVNALPEPGAAADDENEDAYDDDEDAYADDDEDDDKDRDDKGRDNGATPGERRLDAGCGVMALAAAFFSFFGFVKFAEAIVAVFRQVF